MKPLLLFMLTCASTLLAAQNYTKIAVDASGDDYTGNPDAINLYSALSVSGDSILIRLEHFNMRQGDFGYALALDTNQNASDGYMTPQNNLKSGNPNNSLGGDISFYLFQNGVFPTIYSEVYNGSGNKIAGQQFDYEFPSNNEVIFKIALSQIGGDTNLRLLAFTGTFDIAPGGAGPTDVIPNSGFARVAVPHNVGVDELAMGIDIFPNPAKEQVQLVGARHYYEILNVNGSRVKTLQVNNGNPYRVSDLPPGLYFLRADGEGEVFKLMVE